MAPNPQNNDMMIDVNPHGRRAAEFANAPFERGHAATRGGVSPDHVRVSVGRPEENRRRRAVATALVAARRAPRTGAGARQGTRR